MNVIIVDDEEPARKNLASLLQNYCPEVTIVGIANSAEQARQILNTKNVDALFLDISMPNESGFDLLESIDRTKYLFVFVTAYNEYALKALRASAVDYLQKPIDIDELKDAVSKLLRTKLLIQQIPSTSKDYNLSLGGLISNNKKGNEIQRLSLRGSQGFTIIDIDDIIYLDADSNYTIFHLKSFKKIVVSKSIKEFEELLNPKYFFRVHKSSIINLKYLKGFSKEFGYFALMTDNSSIPVSRRRLNEFMEAVEMYTE